MPVKSGRNVISKRTLQMETPMVETVCVLCRGSLKAEDCAENEAESKAESESEAEELFESDY